VSDLRQEANRGGRLRPGDRTALRALLIAGAVVVAVVFFAQRNGVEDAVAESYGGIEADCTNAGTIVFRGREETVYVCQRRDMAAILGCYVFTGGELFDVSGEVRQLARQSSTAVACT
jgi:hypothetical protein